MNCLIFMVINCIGFMAAKVGQYKIGKRYYFIQF